MLTALLLIYVVQGLGMSVFLISENRRPQATLAWLLAFTFLPIFGALLYIFFGRDWKAFSRRSQLMRQDLQAYARPLLAPMLARQDEELARLREMGPTHRKLMTLVRRNSRSVLTRRNQIEILQDATTFYPRLLSDIEAAQHSIHLQYYVWASDPTTERFKDALIAKARAGVEVRLLYDPQGSNASLRKAYIEEMNAGGVRMVETFPLHPIHTISYRNHRKITVIDGKIGYTGGMNMGQEHLDGGEGFDSWRDTQLRMVGEGVHALQTVFLVDWYNAVRENLFAPAYFPDPHEQVSESADVPMQIVTSGPDAEWAAIEQLYAKMIATAQRHVYLQSPYFILSAGVAEALRSAALAGIDVRVMLSARPSGNRLPAWAGNTYVDEIVRSGVRVFLYQKGYLHAKTISIDGLICSIGSANIDIRSFTINYELNAVLYSEALATELEQDFHADLAHCTEYDPLQYPQRPAVERFRDSVARLFSPLL